MSRKLGQKSGLKALIDPQREEATEIHGKLLHGHREYKIIRLRELIEAERNAQRAAQKEMFQCEREAEIARFKKLSRKQREKEKRHHVAVLKGLDTALKQAETMPWFLSDNFLSARANEISARLAANDYVELPELDALWRDLHAQFERAVLDSDAAWFERQGKAIHSNDIRSETDKHRDEFDAAVAHALEMGFWRARAEANSKERIHAMEEKREPNIESATLTPAGKLVNFTGPQEVLDKLGIETKMKAEKAVGFGRTKTLKQQVACVLVCRCRFASMRRAREAVETVRKLYGYLWKKT
jgi:hypothetical protein